MRTRADSCVADCSRLHGGGRGIETLSAHANMHVRVGHPTLGLRSSS